jgi:hypothetical protein
VPREFAKGFTLGNAKVRVSRAEEGAVFFGRGVPAKCSRTRR